MNFIILPLWQTANEFLDGNLDPILRQTGINIEQMGKKLKLVQMYKEKDRQWADTGKEIDFDAEVCTFDKLIGKEKEPVGDPLQDKGGLNINLTDPDTVANDSHMPKPITIVDDLLGESGEKIEGGQSPESIGSLPRKATIDIESISSDTTPKVGNFYGTDGGPGFGGNCEEPPEDKENDLIKKEN